MPRTKSTGLLVPALHPVDDRYRIMLLKALLIIIIPLLTVETLTAYYAGIYGIAVFETFTVALALGLARLFWRKPHYFANAFIVFSGLICIIALVEAIEHPATPMFLLAMPTFYIFYLGLRKGMVIVACQLTLLIAGAAIFSFRNGRLPWPVDTAIFTGLVFSYILTFTVAFETTNKSLLARLQHKAEIDELTGVYTRRTFFEHLRYEMKRVKRYGAPLSLLLWDIDHFKNVNDEHGHQVGDHVLAAVTGRCVRTLRSSDIVGRVGGEEFACLLPEAKQQAALHVAEKIRQAAVEDQGDDLPACSVSLGVAEYASGDTPESLYRRADQALYAAKAAGRDCVRCG